MKYHLYLKYEVFEKYQVFNLYGEIILRLIGDFYREFWEIFDILCKWWKLYIYEEGFEC